MAYWKTLALSSLMIMALVHVTMVTSEAPADQSEKTSNTLNKTDLCKDFNGSKTCTPSNTSSETVYCLSNGNNVTGLCEASKAVCGSEDKTLTAQNMTTGSCTSSGSGVVTNGTATNKEGSHSKDSGGGNKRTDSNDTTTASTSTTPRNEASTVHLHLLPWHYFAWLAVTIATVYPAGFVVPKGLE